MGKVSRGALVTIRMLKEQVQFSSGIARTLGVSGGTVRYRLKQWTIDHPEVE